MAGHDDGRVTIRPAPRRQVFRPMTARGALSSSFQAVDPGIARRETQALGADAKRLSDEIAKRKAKAQIEAVKAKRRVALHNARSDRMAAAETASSGFVPVSTVTADLAAHSQPRLPDGATASGVTSPAGVEYEVESILQRRWYLSGEKEFKVRWRGYGPAEDSWVAEADLQKGCAALLHDFNANGGTPVDDAKLTTQLPINVPTAHSATGHAHLLSEDLQLVDVDRISAFTGATALAHLGFWGSAGHGRAGRSTTDARVSSVS